MASFDVFDSFLIIKTSQEWGRTWYSPWQSKIEAKLHDESKFWRASKPFPNQSSMQGRESEKESNIHEFRNPLRNFCKPKGNFATPFQSCEIFTTLQNLLDNFRYFCTDSVRFLSHDILCNYLFFPCNQLNIFLDI